MEAETPAESIVLDEAQNQSFLGSKLGALIHLERMWFFSNCGRDGMDWRLWLFSKAFTSAD
jgi:hypothetical protein